MRRILIAAPLLLTLAAGVQAADRNWTGVYVGANLGYGNAKASADFSVLGVPLLNGSENLDGMLYGFQAGYNYQIGRVVLGIEADINGSLQKASNTRICAALACNLVAITQTSEDSIPWLGTARLRAGFAFDRFLVYGTAGAGFGEFKSTQTLTTLLGTVTSATSDQRPAWVAGAGIEAAITDHWSVKAEYLYLDTGTFNTTYSLLGIGLITERSRMTDNMFRLGVNYRF
jgi:outer membrane immunogenic protein